MKVRLRSSVVCVHKNTLLCVRLKDPATGLTHSYVPGGAIEANETPSDAALREAREETGYSLKLDLGSSFVSQYPFLWNDTWYQCTTHWFKAFLDPDDQIPSVIQDAAYHCGVEWLPLARIEEAFSYHEQIKQDVMRLVFE
jgi:8-oxo-dGTP pyrophosphatase MutT (NUDIX family)